jgi:exonuclease III
MQPTSTIMKVIVSSFIFGIFVFTTGCKSCSKGNTNQDVNVEVDNEVMNDINQAKKIFYSLPSPLETAMLIKTAGATYNEKLLNPIGNASGYTTNRSMALNLGIYTTDLSFASLFDQTQTSINYMQTAKKMADGLGILDAIDNKTIQKLEENINNRDVIMDIISETFMASSSFLKENDRTAVAAIVLVGGWIEGLYIATQLVPAGNIKNNKLVERIVDQKLSFDIVLKLLAENKENPDVANLIVEMNDLKKIFDKIDIKSSKIQVVTDEKTNVSTLKSQSKITVSNETFVELTVKIKAIRNNFVL